MPKVMLINVTHSEESRVGIMNDRKLESFEIESLSRTHLKGNIYKGVVHRIHPALEAAFVNIGAERDAFLPLDEICFNNLEESPKSGSRNGSSGGGRSQLRIRDVLRPGQEVLVQITKEQFANKPPTVSTFYSLPGRYLVLLPGSEDTGISRRIEGEDRDRLRKVVDEIKPEEGYGLIVRTVAGLEDTSGELARDLDYLKRLWTNVKEAGRQRPAPSLVYREHDIVQRAIRDFYTPDISEIYIDDEEVYERALEFLGAIMPGSESVLRLYRGEQPLFSAFNVEEQIESVFGRRVRLPSGGSIVIDGTEALTAIDVNSGGSVRGANPEETAFRTNTEAAAEVARQLRLRDIGGIIVVDFIDMRDPRHNREIEQLMRDEMRLDKARHETGRLSSLGLMQISRQRLRPAAGASSHTTCPICQGYGSVRTQGSAGLGAIRRIHDRLSLGDVESMTVTLPTEVGLYVLNQKREDLANLESRYESKVEVKLSVDLLPHEVETAVKERSRATKPTKAIEPGAVVEATGGDKPAPERNGSASAESGDGTKRRRRRRRKRGGTSRDGSERSEARSEESGEPRSGEEAAERDAGTNGDNGRETPASARPARRQNRDAESPATSDESGSDAGESGQASAAASGTDAASPGDSAEDGRPSSRPRRSRGRRGGRRRRGGQAGQDAAQNDASPTDPTRREAPSARAESVGQPSPPAAQAKSEPADRRDSSSSTEGAPASRRDTPTRSEAPPAPVIAAAPSATAAKTGDSEAAAPKPKRAAAKKTTATTAAAKKTAAKKATTKRAAAKKTTKKAAPKKAAAKKTTAKKTAAKTTSATKTSATKTTAKRAVAKKRAATTAD